MITTTKQLKRKITALVTQTKCIQFEITDKLPTHDEIKTILEDKFGCAEKIVNQKIDILSIDSLS